MANRSPFKPWPMLLLTLVTLLAWLGMSPQTHTTSNAEPGSKELSLEEFKDLCRFYLSNELQLQRSYVIAFKDEEITRLSTGYSFYSTLDLPSANQTVHQRVACEMNSDANRFVITLFHD